jgi:aryl-alcohol dehydrogenase-like predicted oxidoreductase
MAERLVEHCRERGTTLTAFALNWLWANRLVTAAIAGPRTMEQWQAYLAAVDAPWAPEDEALVDGLVPAGHPSTPGYTDPRYPIEGRVLG